MRLHDKCAPGFQIAPRAAMQVVVTLGVTVLAPFANPPRLNMGYTLGGGGGAAMSESLALPAVRHWMMKVF